jgi:hypothetical protein
MFAVQGGSTAYPARQSIKLQGRRNSIDELRKRCVARLQENRRDLLEQMRARADNDLACSRDLRAFARDVVMAEIEVAGLAVSSNSHLKISYEDDFMDEETLIALEEELLMDLEREAHEQAVLEAEWLEEQQHAADCELYEQHLLGGVPCPLCHVGRLDMQAGELRCTSCDKMRAAVMDESLGIDMACELLALAEDRHRHGGCLERATFEVREDHGPSLLFLCCESCGWCEVVL